MTEYCVYHDKNFEIFEFLGSRLPNHYRWPSGAQTSPIRVGDKREGLVICELVDEGDAPTPYHDRSGFGRPVRTGNTVTRPQVYVPRDLAHVKGELKIRIDEEAERMRQQYITPGHGQALEYREVVDEANNYVIDGVGSFPLLQASVDAGEVATLQDAANLVRTRHNAWLAIGADIRRVRLREKLRVDQATTVDEAWKAYESIVWDLA